MPHHYPNHSTGVRFLLPRSGLMILDVGFNPRSARYFDRPVASATIESDVRLITVAGSPVADATGEAVFTRPWVETHG
jgi:hypothetical protein